MARRSISITEKIETQKQAVAKAKAKYDAELAKLDVLMQKQDDIRNKELLDAITSSEKSYDEIMQFLAPSEEAAE